MRTTVKDEPGSLAALCLTFATHGVDIITLGTHPLADGTVDDFLLRAPVALEAKNLVQAISAAGGIRTWIERADTHDLADTPTRALAIATHVALDDTELPLALRRLLGRCTVSSQPASAPGAAAGGGYPRDWAGSAHSVDGVLEATVLRLRSPRGDLITVERPSPPFTPTEFARARALIELDARLGPRGSAVRDNTAGTIPMSDTIVVAEAGEIDLEAARALHSRCSPRTLNGRYRAPAGDADQYLGHLLSPLYGRSLAARTISGRMIALGHLLSDGGETEIALIVEDAWQRQGVGTELLSRLVALATEERRSAVYAVTQPGNRGMIAVMRRLGLPLDYQLEEGTLVVTAQLDVSSAALPPFSDPGPLAHDQSDR